MCADCFVCVCVLGMSWRGALRGFIRVCSCRGSIRDEQERGSTGDGVSRRKGAMKFGETITAGLASVYVATALAWRWMGVEAACMRTAESRLLSRAASSSARGVGICLPSSSSPIAYLHFGPQACINAWHRVPSSFDSDFSRAKSLDICITFSIHIARRSTVTVTERLESRVCELDR